MLQGEHRGPHVHPFAPEPTGEHAAAQLGKGQPADLAELADEEVVIDERLARGTADGGDVAVNRPWDLRNAFHFSAGHLGILIKLCPIARTEQQQI